MSFQRIIDLARRQGIPVVVTGENGQDAVVVLPLEVYEALLGESKPVPASAPTHVPTQPSTRLERIANEVIQEVESKLERNEEVELSLEERFYVEPLDDQQNR